MDCTKMYQTPDHHEYQQIYKIGKHIVDQKYKSKIFSFNLTNLSLLKGVRELSKIKQSSKA